MLALGWDPPCSGGRKPPPPGAGTCKAVLTLSLKARPRGGREGQQSGASSARSRVPGPHPPVAGRPGVEGSCKHCPTVALVQVLPWGKGSSILGSESSESHIRL